VEGRTAASRTLGLEEALVAVVVVEEEEVEDDWSCCSCCWAVVLLAAMLTSLTAGMAAYLRRDTPRVSLVGENPYWTIWKERGAPPGERDDNWEARAGEIMAEGGGGEGRSWEEVLVVPLPPLLLLLQGLRGGDTATESGDEEEEEEVEGPRFFTATDSAGPQ